MQMNRRANDLTAPALLATLLACTAWLTGCSRGAPDAQQAAKAQNDATAAAAANARPPANPLRNA